MLSCTNRTRKLKFRKAALESGTELASKRVKAIKLADKSWRIWMGDRYQIFVCRDELVSDSDDDKRIYWAERRAVRKINNEKRRRVRSVEKRSGSSSAFRAASSSSFSSKDLASRSEARPARWLDLCFKISSLHFFVILALFCPRLWRYSQPIIQYSP